jgi:SAM-dependent methyltransferase
MLSLWFRSRVLHDRAARWNYQYATGKWDQLKNEQARLATTALLLIRHLPPGRVLEIGCGEALLQQQINPADYLGWLGVDISDLAIRKAQAFATDRVRYLTADMETFDPGGQFDAIVFTESIYYSASPGRLLRRYARFLNPGGVFIISIFRTKRSDAIWTEIHAEAAAFDGGTTTSELGTWHCEALRPRACGGRIGS